MIDGTPRTHASSAVWLRSERLLLRPVTPADCAVYHAILTQPEVRRFLLDDVIVSEDWVHEEIRRSADLFAAEGCGTWMIIAEDSSTAADRAQGDELQENDASRDGEVHAGRRSRDGARVIGFCGFRHFFEPPELQLFYGLDARHWGRGMATEACRAVIRHGFDALGFDGITAATDPPNAASVRVLERLGMRSEGTLMRDGVPAAYYRLDRPAFEDARPT